MKFYNDSTIPLLISLTVLCLSLLYPKDIDVYIDTDSENIDIFMQM